ncbi:MAG: LacI family DNA-binding transcriptional regulator [Clostridia bacterium]|nr:LacI family DNA-binding transcriptional regulator [Clostridia bacterium]
MEKNRVGLKEIAELSGMSVGNVSMVLRGLGDEARISKASQEKIQNAARQLNYKPNVYAKRLRMKADRMIVAVFFASSRHLSVMGAFFSGIHELLSGTGDMKPEITLYPYTQGQLDRMDSVIREECFNGAIFMGMSSEDMDYLETVRIDTPIVVFNRISKIHHYVYADNQNVGELAARLFSRAGDAGVCLVSGRKLSTAGRERRDGFIGECARLGIPLPPERILQVTPGYEGGREAAEAVAAFGDSCRAVFFSDDQMGISALHELLIRGIRVPEQIKIICYNGSNSDMYSIPSLSNIRIPLEEISRDCLVLLDKAIRNPESGQMNIVHKPILILRESTGA